MQRTFYNGAASEILFWIEFNFFLLLDKMHKFKENNSIDDALRVFNVDINWVLRVKYVHNVLTLSDLGVRLFFPLFWKTANLVYS